MIAPYTRKKRSNHPVTSLQSWSYEKARNLSLRSCILFEVYISTFLEHQLLSLSGETKPSSRAVGDPLTRDRLELREFQHFARLAVHRCSSCQMSKKRFSRNVEWVKKKVERDGEGRSWMLSSFPRRSRDLLEDSVPCALVLGTERQVLPGQGFHIQGVDPGVGRNTCVLLLFPPRLSLPYFFSPREREETTKSRRR